VRYILFAFAILWAGIAQASQIKITSIESSWTVKSIVDLTGGNGNLTGNGTNEIRWGTPFPGYNGQKSGFKFQQTAQGTTQNSDTLFNVGVFTHMNRVIFQNQYLDRAQLNMKVTADFGGESRTFVTSYMFSLWETPNYANPCANGQQNGLNSKGKPREGGSLLNRSGCADRVQLLKNDALTDQFVINGLTYQFELFGFDSGAEFWTVEDLDNSTWLKARFNVSGFPPPPPPSVVPLPAGAWLLLGGLGGLALLRRRAARG
jgi:hypothetical protein